MEPLRQITIALYNVDREPESTSSERTFIHINANASQAHAFQIIKKKEIALTFEEHIDDEDQVKITINPVMGLSRGQLMIDAPELLNEKAWCIQLPRNRALNEGLILAIHKPGKVEATTLQYHAPTADTKAILKIAMPAPNQIEKVGIITWEVGTVRKPVLTEMGDGYPQSHLMTITRLLAYEGAYTQSRDDIMTVVLPQNNTSTDADQSDHALIKQEN